MAVSSIFVKPPGPVAPGLRIGLLGGSFNPAHRAHLHVSRIARARLGLDRVWWLVSPQNPLKPAAGMAPLNDRLRGARTVAAGDRFIHVSTLEAALGTRYTADTLGALRQRFPGVRFVWLMGADNLAGFHRWRGWTAIARAVPVAIIARPGATLSPLSARFAQRFRSVRLSADSAAALPFRRPPSWVYLNARLDPISATALRAAGAAP